MATPPFIATETIIGPRASVYDIVEATELNVTAADAISPRHARVGSPAQSDDDHAPLQSGYSRPVTRDFTD